MSPTGNGNGHRPVSEIERVRRRASETRQHLDETVHRVAENAPQAARENPVPVAIIAAVGFGVVIGWSLRHRT